MKAILTKYLGPTNTKPARIKASAEGVESKIYSRDSLDHPLKDPHTVAAESFATELSWNCNFASGQLPNGDWAHCFIPPTNSPIIPEKFITPKSRLFPRK